MQTLEEESPKWTYVLVATSLILGAFLGGFVVYQFIHSSAPPIQLEASDGPTLYLAPGSTALCVLNTPANVTITGTTITFSCPNRLYDISIGQHGGLFIAKVCGQIVYSGTNSSRALETAINSAKVCQP